jgi:hypothetical protein
MIGVNHCSPVGIFTWNILIIIYSKEGEFEFAHFVEELEKGCIECTGVKRHPLYSLAGEQAIE